MKNTITKLMMALVLMGTLSECKKGPDDPLISLRSRKARVTGDWQVTEGTSTNIYSSGNYSSSSSSSYSKISYSRVSTSTYNGTTTTNTKNGTFQFSISFEKDGTFSLTRAMDTDISTIKGTWNFTGKVGELKNKEQIVLNVTSETVQGSNTVTYKGNQTYATYTIIELRNKKMKLVAETSAVYPGGDSETGREEYTFEQ